MSDSSPAAARTPVTQADLFMGFLKVGVSGFGGVMPFARRMLVDERAWLTEREFTEVLSLSQFLPGPNIIASVGLMLMPFLIVLALSALYARFAALDAVRGATATVSSAATGLIIAMALKMGRPLAGTAWQMLVAALAFVALALLRVPLIWALLALIPLSVALAWRSRR